MCNQVRIDAAAPLQRYSDVQVIVTSSGLWLVNRGSSAALIKHGELFGFNTGSFAEVPAGWGAAVKMLKDSNL